MQDLFQLGPFVENAGTAQGTGRTARKPGAASRGDDPWGLPSFEAMLALAAMTAPHTPPPDQRSAGSMTASHLTAISVGPQSEPASGASESALPSSSRLFSGLDGQADGNHLPGADASDAASASAVRDLLHHLAGGQKAQDQSSIAIGALQRETDGQPPLRTVSSRTALDSILAELEATGDDSGDSSGTTPSLDLVQAEMGDDEAQIMSYPDRFGGNRTGAEPGSTKPRDGRVLDYATHWATRQPDTNRPSRTGFIRRFGDNGLNIPDLRVVARNENPAPTTDLTPPDLHLIELNPVEDLATRLAGSWEHSFLYGEEAPAKEPLLTSLPAMAVRERGLRDRSFAGEQDIAVSDESDDIAPAPVQDDARVEQPEASTSDLQTADEDSGSRQHESADSVPGPATSGSTASGSAHRPTVSPVPLFDNLLSIQNNPGTSNDAESPVEVRQAAMEIVNELRHLQRTGGTELSFNLRLHPDHLGQVEVEIQRAGNVWSISIVAASDEARDALAGEISRLEHRFRENHLRLDGISVVTKPAHNAISAATANDRSGEANFLGTGQDSWTGEENRDQSGWRNNASAGILGFDSQGDAEIGQDLTRRHGSSSDSGIDIKA